MSTPMLQQVAALKREAGDAILFTRMGDFYELHGEDAVKAAPVMEIALTVRGRGTEYETPMCGVPHFALESYLPKLLAAGYSAAIAEPTAKPEEVKGLLPRALTRIITPGTWLDDDARWLAAVHRIGAAWGIALVQLASGQLRVIPGEGEAFLASTLERLAPQELILAEGAPDAFDLEAARVRLPAWRFEPERARNQVMAFFGWSHLEGVGLDPHPAATGALGALLDQLETIQRGRPAHIQGVSLELGAAGPLLDATSARHLEVFANTLDGSRQGSLLELMDLCRCRMGSRLLKAWLDQPLRDRAALERRWTQVGWFTEDRHRDPVQKLIAGVPDLDRILGRVAMGLATPPELAQLREGLARVQKLPRLMVEEGWFGETADLGIWPEGTPLCGELEAELRRCLAEAPPLELEKGGTILDGVDPELDAVRRLARDAKQVMLELEEEERAASGISSLKIKYNRVFGYYFEITKSNLASAPAHFIRKQTLANAERFTTEKLMAFEQRLLSAESDLLRLEEAQYRRLLARVLEDRAGLASLARAVAFVDVLCALGERARVSGWTRPALSEERELVLAGARHPMLEARMGRECIPNDLSLPPGRAMAVVTGPNMGGKSTFLRTAALLVVLAQTGSYVPAELMRLSLVDRIFTRIGASDFLAKGQSTFMVEMTETARILNQVTPSSLVILDEIGRGTSTRDGLALAEAIALHLRDLKGGEPRTLFATHYFELTKLADDPRIQNLHVEVQEWEEHLLFLHRISPGPADRSYGIQVARLAGLPRPVIAAAQRILADTPEPAIEAPRRGRKARAEAAQPLLPMFDPEPDPLRAELEALDLDGMSPRDVVAWVAARQKERRA
ncbi:DNA mismatch repair protein MutS [Mesoterricola sediminis]|uniref:DNA mismatch repair protein MutS n=1 Tax=Mesoterricola sediminis TaxID=2927980 RepID=A0AA48GQA7_9BACT|nr:DNA mismatch repair protein MutS [Mesoterricola sediminis]BDU75609.1 DNA mismatch repair protein MutS [Mesoterricola sediminis]